MPCSPPAPSAVPVTTFPPGARTPLSCAPPAARLPRPRTQRTLNFECCPARGGRISFSWFSSSWSSCYLGGVQRSQYTPSQPSRTRGTMSSRTPRMCAYHSCAPRSCAPPRLASNPAPADIMWLWGRLL
jgi:hypothetical protein